MSHVFLFLHSYHAIMQVLECVLWAARSNEKAFTYYYSFSFFVSLVPIPVTVYNICQVNAFAKYSNWPKGLHISPTPIIERKEQNRLERQVGTQWWSVLNPWLRSYIKTQNVIKLQVYISFPIQPWFQIVPLLFSKPYSIYSRDSLS